jgi:hypothetical protein
MEEGEHVMPGRHRKTGRNTFALRLTGGLITGAALTATVAAAHAGTASGKPALRQAAADLAVIAPAGAVAKTAANAPARVAPAGTTEVVSLQAARARQDVRKQDARKHNLAKQKAGARQKSAAPVASAQDVINLAEKQVGIQEDASGVTKFQQWYMTTHQAQLTVRRDGGSIADYGNAAWCDMFVSWVGQQVGARGMGQDAYTVEHAKWFQKSGRWGTIPKPGAVVFFAWNGGGTDGIDHVGLVVKDNGDGTIKTVEGNTGNAVMVRDRATDSVVGYGYPQYAK